MLQDPTFWVAVAFVIFAAAVAKPIARMASSGLDKRGDEIRKQLEEAEALRTEAQKMLAEYKRKQRDAEKEAEEMLAHAKAESQRLSEKSKQDLEASLKRSEALALEKIKQAEANALKEVRNQAIEVAVAATAKLLSENLDKKRSDDLVQSAIDDLGGKLH